MQADAGAVLPDLVVDTPFVATPSKFSQINKARKRVKQHTDETGRPPQSNRDRFQQIETAADMEMDVPREAPRGAKQTAEASTARINISTWQLHGQQQQAAKQAVRVNEEEKEKEKE